MRRPAILVALILWVGGCARYEYDLVQPRDLAGHIGQEWTTVPRDPLEYRMRTVENRLVMHIRNPTNEPIALLGERSYVVAPNGQSHPLYSQTIAPGTFIRLILPPARPYWEPRGPTIGIGFGFASGYHHRHYGYYHSYYPFYGPYYYPYWYDYPRYYVYYNESDRTWWEWSGQTDAKLRLVFQRGKEILAHEFVIHRRKM